MKRVWVWGLKFNPTNDSASDSLLLEIEGKAYGTFIACNFLS